LDCLTVVRRQRTLGESKALKWGFVEVASQEEASAR